MHSAIKRKLWLIMAVMLFFVVAVGLFGLVVITVEVNAVRELVQQDLVLDTLVNRLRLDLLQQRRYEKDFLLNIGNPDKQKEYLDKFNGTVAAFLADAGKISQMAQVDPHLTGDIKEKSAELAANYHNYLEGFRKVVKEVEADPTITPQQANARLAAVKEGIPVIEGDLEALDRASTRMLAEVALAAVAQGKKARCIILVVLIAAAILAGVLGSLLSRSVYRAIFAEGVRRMAHRV